MIFALLLSFSTGILSAINKTVSGVVPLDQALQYTLHFIVGDTIGTGIILFLFYQLLKLNLKWRRRKNNWFNNRKSPSNICTNCQINHEKKISLTFDNSWFKYSYNCIDLIDFVHIYPQRWSNITQIPYHVDYSSVGPSVRQTMSSKETLDFHICSLDSKYSSSGAINHKAHSNNRIGNNLYTVPTSKEHLVQIQ